MMDMSSAVVEYRARKDLAIQFARNIRLLHDEFSSDMFPRDAPDPDDTSIHAFLYWERDMMLSILVGSALVNGDGTITFRARIAANNLVEYAEAHTDLMIEECRVLDQHLCPACGGWFDRDIGSHYRWGGSCDECLILAHNPQ